MAKKDRHPVSRRSEQHTRQPVTVATPAKGKHPVSGRVQGDEEAKPVWAFSIADTGGPWCWTRMGIQGMCEVLQRLQDFEGMTWTEILQGTGSHHVSIRNLCSDAQKRLRDIGQDDIEELFSLRICGRERVWGIRVGRVLRLLWWDPTHAVCPSHKKGT